MSFSFNEWIMNPFVLMFISVFTGMLFGKVKFGKFNFGVSGTLFTGLFFGWLVVKYAKTFVEGDKLYDFTQNFINKPIVPGQFFVFFLMLFVVSVGLLASKDIGVILKKYGTKFVVLGIFITFVGAATTYGMTLFVSHVLESDATPYEVSGVYTGALTSSPGLAAATETAHAHAEGLANDYASLSEKQKKDILKQIEVKENVSSLTEEMKHAFIDSAEAGIGLGYAVGYPFGVIIVILAVNFIPKIFKIDIEEEKKIYAREIAEAKKMKPPKEIEETDFDLISFSFAVLVGYLVGKVGIDLGFLGLHQKFSLGATGGALIASLVLGYIGKIGKLNFRMNSKVLQLIRQIALAFFLAVVGLKYGYRVIYSLLDSALILALVGVVVGFVSMFLGFLLGRYVFKINWIMLSGAICGGMTSTPGLGATIDAVGSDDPAAGYGATYPFALIGMVLFTIILHGLPM